VRVNPRPILAASDLSPRSAQVGPRAAAIAATRNARLIFAHVAPQDKVEDPQQAPAVAAGFAEPDAEFAHADAAPGGLRTLGKRLLGRRPRRGAPHPGPAISAAAEGLVPRPEIRLLVGEPAAELAALACTEDAELMVLGLHGERRVLDVLRLTTMERIVLAAPVPVLIAHCDAARPYRRVLALTDFSPASAAALRFAAWLAPEAEFHAIHALQLPLGALFSGQEAASDEHLTRAEQMRAAFLASPGLPELAEAPEIVTGGVHEVLAFRQGELAADLVCIGTHSGRDPSQIGNYARDLMRAPPTDLLVAKPG
jgi:nucleotide-binding universal stress UspA family protein